ncbi:hypothetical protein RIF29_21737 [Crotalaria pallida]|uniref:RNase H type-1 domain-containing protein n=1 Tax=Crotalaria pallida TaxID=3830 RepID=A0AAN9F3G3_CROPI
MGPSKPPDPGLAQTSATTQLNESTRNLTDGVKQAPENGPVVTEQVSTEGNENGNPSVKEVGETNPENLGGLANFEAEIGEPTHGDWLVVTRRKRSKPKNPRAFKSNDMDKIQTNNTQSHARVLEARVVTGSVNEKITKQADVVVKRGPGKRSRMEGKHATPTHILLRNAGVKGLENGISPKPTQKSFSFQAGNFGATSPRLFKDTQVQASMLEEDGLERRDVDVVPETQLVFDPGQILISKYAPQGFNLFNCKSDGSPTWRAINKAKQMLLSGFRLRVGAGDVSFFFDNWLRDEPLSRTVPWVATQDTALKVKDVWHHGSWHLESLYTILPFEVKQEIINSGVMVNAEVSDCITWIGKGWFWDENNVVVWIRHGVRALDSLFVSMVWWIWRARCSECIANQAFTISEVSHLALSMHEDINRCFGEASASSSQLRWVTWNPSCMLGVVLNVDGSVMGNPGAAGFGGLVRTNEGKWLCGFAGHFGTSNNIHMELLAIYQGLVIAWNRPPQTYD